MKNVSARRQDLEPRRPLSELAKAFAEAKALARDATKSGRTDIIIRAEALVDARQRELRQALGEDLAGVQGDGGISLRDGTKLTKAQLDQMLRGEG